MNDLNNIPAGMPLEKGAPCIVKDGCAYAAAEGEKPTHRCTVDCTTNAKGVLEAI